MTKVRDVEMCTEEESSTFTGGQEGISMLDLREVVAQTSAQIMVDGQLQVSFLWQLEVGLVSSQGQGMHVQECSDRFG
jgi:hypothetical protein